MATIKGTYANALVYSDDMEEYARARLLKESGESVIIPVNMRDGIIMGIGK